MRSSGFNWDSVDDVEATVTNPPRLVILFVVPWITNFGRTEEKAKLPWMRLLLPMSHQLTYPAFKVKLIPSFPSARRRKMLSSSMKTWMTKMRMTRPGARKPERE